MVDFLATHRALQAARAQIAADKAHLKRLSIKVSEAQKVLQRANIAYRKSLPFISPIKATQRVKPSSSEEG